MVEEELLAVTMDTIGEDLLDIMTNMVEGELLDVETDTEDKEFLTGMVAGAMVSSHSEARKPAWLRLKSLKSFLVIAIVSLMGEPLALQ